MSADSVARAQTGTTPGALSGAAGARSDVPLGALLSPGPDGMLRTLPIGTLALEAGGELPNVVLGFETWGRLNADASNAVLVLHALTGGTHVSRGSSPEDGWWEGLVGPGCGIDTDQYFVVAPNVLGGCNGTTGPSSPAPDGRPWGSRFPLVTLRDAVAAELRLADALGIGRWHSVIGGSMGGARALEWAATAPDRVRRCLCVAACAASTAEQIALGQAQLLAIRQDAAFAGGDYYDGAAPQAGLGLARRIAHISYRSEPELSARFGRKAQGAEEPLRGVSGAGQSSGRDNFSGQGRGRYQVESYLDHQAQKLLWRFDANSYIAITEALISHDVTRGRGSVGRIFAGTEVEFVVAAVNTDRLYLPGQSEQLARELRAVLPGRVRLETIDSAIGHDGFLTETGQLARIFAG